MHKHAQKIFGENLWEVNWRNPEWGECLLQLVYYWNQIIQRHFSPKTEIRNEIQTCLMMPVVDHGGTRTGEQVWLSHSPRLARYYYKNVEGVYASFPRIDRCGAHTWICSNRYNLHLCDDKSKLLRFFEIEAYRQLWNQSYFRTKVLSSASRSEKYINPK